MPEKLFEHFLKKKSGCNMRSGVSEQQNIIVASIGPTFGSQVRGNV